MNACPCCTVRQQGASQREKAERKRSDVLVVENMCAVVVVVVVAAAVRSVFRSTFLFRLLQRKKGAGAHHLPVSTHARLGCFYSFKVYVYIIYNMCIPDLDLVGKERRCSAVPGG